MSEPKIVEKLKKDIIGYFDKYLVDFEKKIKLVEKTKNEILKNTGDLQDILDMFDKYNIEIVDYKRINCHFDEPPKYTDIKPYAGLEFTVKKPGNNILLNIKAKYSCYHGKYIINGKQYRKISGYELYLSNNGFEAVNKKSARAKQIKECVNIFKNKYKQYSFPSVDIVPPDKIEEDLFFYLVNNLLSIKSNEDIKKFKNFTALEIHESYDTMRKINALDKSDNNHFINNFITFR